MNDDITSYDYALSRGLRRYRTGKPCRHGHFGERYTATKRCIACVKEMRVDTGEGAAYARKWRAANRERSRAYIRTYMRSYKLSPAQRERKRLYQIERRRKGSGNLL